MPVVYMHVRHIRTYITMHVNRTILMIISIQNNDHTMELYMYVAIIMYVCKKSCSWLIQFLYNVYGK